MTDFYSVVARAIKKSGADMFWIDRIMEAVRETVPPAMGLTEAVVPKDFPRRPATWLRADGKKFELSLKGDRWIGKAVKAG